MNFVAAGVLFWQLLTYTLNDDVVDDDDRGCRRKNKVLGWVDSMLYRLVLTAAARRTPS